MRETARRRVGEGVLARRHPASMVCEERPDDRRQLLGAHLDCHFLDEPREVARRPDTGHHRGHAVGEAVGNSRRRLAIGGAAQLYGDRRPAEPVLVRGAVDLPGKDDRLAEAEVAPDVGELGELARIAGADEDQPGGALGAQHQGERLEQPARQLRLVDEPE